METRIYRWPYRRAECVHYPDGRVVCVRLIGRGGKDLLVPARAVAGDWYSGQTDPLYAFLCTGTIRGEYGGRIWDLRDAWDLDDLPKTALRALEPVFDLCAQLRGE